MFPWNYGFHWSLGTMIFMGAFYTVLTVIAAAVITSALRSRRVLASDSAEKIRWQSDFHDLPERDRACRHALTGELAHRVCHNSFDCRTCPTHAKMLQQQTAAQSEDLEEGVFGMEYPLDRLYFRGHTWVHPETDGTVTVGIDDLGRRLVGSPDSVETPQPGERIQAYGTAFRVHKRGADVRLLSPIDGDVVACGETAEGWILKVKPEGGITNLRHLLTGPEIKPWLMREMERLQVSLSGEGAVPTLADGGEPVADIAAGYPKADWDAVCGDMFLRP